MNSANWNWDSEGSEKDGSDAALRSYFCPSPLHGSKDITDRPIAYWVIWSVS